MTDSDACGSGSLTSTILDSPVIDVNIPNVQTVTLEYDDVFYRQLDDNSTVEVWDGAAWQVVWADSNVNVTDHQVLDVTAFAAGNSNFQVRFNYQDATWDWWFAVDNVTVTVNVTQSVLDGLHRRSDALPGAGRSCGDGADARRPDHEQRRHDRRRLGCDVLRVDRLQPDLRRS